ncbi:MAG: serine/threonine protein kinase, partial [Sandaracinaceae bacterium]|nr:serine/threonine protein kinase [Sandaracinaceae bacterium]
MSATVPHYRRVRGVAVGGMGRVDLAVRVHGPFRRTYAVKRLRSAFRRDPVAQRLFLEEARIAGLIRHPHVVSVIDVGEDEQGVFLVMDFVEGVPLHRLLAELAPGERLPARLCAEIVRQVAKGLHAAHELTDTRGAPLGVVHRDVSPPNILVGFDGVVRLTDFGIARAPGYLSDPGTSGAAAGRLGYLSPEQHKFEELDRRSDLFSLGVVLHELLTGARLYAGAEPHEIAHRALTDSPPDVTDVRGDVHPALVQLLYQMLAKRRDDRPATARVVAVRLGAILAEDELHDEGDLESVMCTRFGALREQLRADLA